MALSFPGCLIAAQQKWLRTTQTPVSSITLARRKSGHKADLALSRILQVCWVLPWSIRHCCCQIVQEPVASVVLQHVICPYKATRHALVNASQFMVAVLGSRECPESNNGQLRGDRCTNRQHLRFHLLGRRALLT